MAKVKAVIFDMDGTVANTLTSIAGFGNAALEAHRLKTFPVDRYRTFVGNGADILMRRMLTAAKGTYTEEDVKALRKTYDALYESDPTKDVTPYPGIVELLQKMRENNVKAAVLSNKPDNMTCYIAEKLFTGLFDVVHGQREGVPKKPDPSAALLLCEELGVTPAECLYVGDSGVDMQTGQNAGLFTAGVHHGASETKRARKKRRPIPSSITQRSWKTLSSKLTAMAIKSFARLFKGGGVLGQRPKN